MGGDSGYEATTSRRAALLLLLFLVPHAGAQANPGGPYQYARFSPSMAIIVVVLVATLFVMAFFSIYIRHCNQGTDSVRLREGRPSAAAHGLDPSVVDNFPTFAYSAVKMGKGALECAVCLSEFHDHETLRLLPKCDHVFHPHCIDAWLASHTTCPVCRADLAPPVHPEPDNQAHVQPLAPEVMAVNFSDRGSSSLTRKFPRSHSTGHSLVQPGEDTERFTLRLPEEARRQIMANRRMNRATSMVVLPREGSTRRGYRRLETAKSGRWVFTAAPPFLARPKLGDGEASVSPSIFERAFSIRLSRHAARQEGQSTDSLV